MIARIWRGTTREEDAERYREYLDETGVKEARATPGNRGVLVMRRVEDGRAEFFFASFWESMEAIRGFAGDDVERAVYYPEDRRYLLELDPKVRHYEVVGGEMELLTAVSQSAQV
jgi:heme-degrading monooxygenase HmoA